MPGTGQGRKERYRRRVEPTDENRSAFDAAHRGVERREAALPALVRESLADLNGKRVLHLGAGTGAATVEFVELGATVTGVDPSDGALAVARERGPSVLWIDSELDSLPAELLRSRHDLVYAGPETTQGARDLDHFAATVASALRPGGDLLLFDEHPAALCIDGLMHWREDYFAQGFRRLGQLVGALGRHDLVVRALEEFPAGRARTTTPACPSSSCCTRARRARPTSRFGRAGARRCRSRRTRRSAGSPAGAAPSTRTSAAERHVDAEAMAALHELPRSGSRTPSSIWNSYRSVAIRFPSETRSSSCVAIPTYAAVSTSPSRART